MTDIQAACFRVMFCSKFSSLSMTRKRVVMGAISAHYFKDLQHRYMMSFLWKTYVAIGIIVLVQ